MSSLRRGENILLAACSGLVSVLAVGSSGADTQDFGRRTAARVEGEVQADEPGRAQDGVYSRFAGDLALAVGLGAELGETTRAAARMSLHYFYMAGVYITYRDAFNSSKDVSGTDAPSARAARVLSFGVDLRPAFIPRWSKNYEQGPSLLDLGIDSISLGMGAFLAELPDAAFGDERGFELSLGFGLPLAGKAPGPWLEARALLSVPDAGERSTATAFVLLSWHTLFVSPLAGAVD